MAKTAQHAPRTVRFYEISRRKRKHTTAVPLDMTAVFQALGAASPATHRRDPEPPIAGWVDQYKKRPFKFNVANLREKDFPLLVSGKMEKSALRKQVAGSLARLSHFVLFKHPAGEVLGCASSNGPRGATAMKWITAFGGDAALDLDLDGIYSDGLLTAINGLKEIRWGEVHTGRDDVMAAKGKNDPLLRNLQELIDLGELRGAALVLRPLKSKPTVLVSALQLLAKSFGLDTAEDAVSVGRDPIVRVVGVSKTLDRDIAVDLLDHMLVKDVNVKTLLDDDDTLDDQDAYRVIEAAFDVSCRKEIDAHFAAKRGNK